MISEVTPPERKNATQTRLRDNFEFCHKIHRLSSYVCRLSSIVHRLSSMIVRVLERAVLSDPTVHDILDHGFRAVKSDDDKLPAFAIFDHSIVES